MAVIVFADMKSSGLFIMSLLTELLIRKTDNFYHNITPNGAFIELRRSEIMVENGNQCFFRAP
jgi:hypothetical protein